MKRVTGAFVAVALMVTALSILTSTVAGAGSVASLKARLLTSSDLPPDWKTLDAGNPGGAWRTCLEPVGAGRGGVRAVASFGPGGGTEVQEVLFTGPRADAAYRAAVGRDAACRSLTISESGVTYTGHGFALPFAPVGDRSRAFAYRLAHGSNPLGADIVIFREGDDVGSVLLQDRGLPDAVQLQSFVAEAAGRLVKDGTPVASGGAPTSAPT
ncbi:MAG: hypothetical protein ACLPVF_18680 [Acidimicrobiales bacterium]